MKRLLILEDGSVYEGIGFGGDEFKIGELIFQTGMCGYQETISDMSYYGQIVMMTYPAIGNVGINRVFPVNSPLIDKITVVKKGASVVPAKSENVVACFVTV
jgi:carbamoylphosphate synthase small subunit